MESLSNVEMTELSEEELMIVDGGVDWLLATGGVCTIIAGAASPGLFSSAAGICGGTKMVESAFSDAPSQQ